MPISWNAVIFKFRWIFATDERRIVSGQTFRLKPIDPWQQKKHGSMGFPKTPYGRFVPVCPDKILRSSVAKIQWNLKITVFQEVGIDSKLLNQI